MLSPKAASELCVPTWCGVSKIQTAGSHFAANFCKLHAGSVDVKIQVYLRPQICLYLAITQRTLGERNGKENKKESNAGGQECDSGSSSTALPAYFLTQSNA